MATRTWKLEHQNGSKTFAIVGYEETGHREMKAMKAMEDLNHTDLKEIISVLHDYFHSEE